jgi:hypothetical protein
MATTPTPTMTPILTTTVMVRLLASPSEEAGTSMGVGTSTAAEVISMVAAAVMVVDSN